MHTYEFCFKMNSKTEHLMWISLGHYSKIFNNQKKMLGSRAPRSRHVRTITGKCQATEDSLPTRRGRVGGEQVVYETLSICPENASVAVKGVYSCQAPDLFCLGEKKQAGSCRGLARVDPSGIHQGSLGSGITWWWEAPVRRKGATVFTHVDQLT